MSYGGSRRERREAKFLKTAEHGNFESGASLYKSESINLVKNGFTVIRHGNNEKISLPSTVYWKNVFKKGIPPVVSEYITGEIEHFPKGLNWAQELYVIAARANNEKAQTNNE